MDIKLLEKLEKNNSSLKYRITFFFVFFLLAVFIVFVITSVFQVNTVARFIGFRYAMPAVQRAMEIIDTESFDRLSRTMDSSDPYYIETQLKLLEIKEETNVMYLYTMAQEEGSMFVYIIDGSDIMGGEGFSEIGNREDIGFWDRAALRAFQTGNVQMGTLDQQDEWGALISAYAPIKKATGEVIGLLACDIDAIDVSDWIRMQVLWQLVIVAIFVALGLVVYISVIKLVNKNTSFISASE